MTQFNKLVFEIPYFDNSEGYFTRLKPLQRRVWLDSGWPSFKKGQFDILSASPSKVMLDPDIAEIESEVSTLKSNAFLSFLEQLDIPFWGGAIGYFNYEYNAKAFGLDHDKCRLSQSVFGIFEWALIQNHCQKKSFVVFLPCFPQEKRQSVVDLICAENVPPLGKFKVNNLDSDMSKLSYEKAFGKIESYIHEGDAYQINFSQRFSGDFSGQPDAAYIALRKILPSPFSAYIELADEVVLSFSPERFIEIENNEAKTQPIKGTAPRNKNSEHDKRLAEELLKSDKNRAENVMIVDLLRNDFNKSCEPFSVKVPSLFSLQSFANVHHLVSTVVGKIKKDISPLTFFMRCFPGGSITGAPKKRAMEIITELEEHPRNIYCGSICYLSVTGRFDSSITIRTLLVSNNQIFCWGGGGIVADSNYESEFQESLQKINILIDALKS